MSRVARPWRRAGNLQSMGGSSNSTDLPRWKSPEPLRPNAISAPGCRESGALGSSRLVRAAGRSRPLGPPGRVAADEAHELVLRGSVVGDLHCRAEMATVAQELLDEVRRAWRKSTRSGAGNDCSCVEVAFRSDDAGFAHALDRGDFIAALRVS